MYIRQVTPRYSVTGDSTESVSAREREFRADFDQYKQLCRVPLARTCYVAIKGEYVDNIAEAKNTLRGMTLLNSMLVENGEFHHSANVEDADPADLFYELWRVSRVLPDNAHLIVTLHDDTEFGQGCMKAIRYVVKPGVVTMHDIRREGVNERAAILQKKLNDIQSEMAVLAHVLQQLDAEETSALDTNVITPAEIEAARNMPGASWDGFVPEDD